jgi:phosphotriesterase-related protein
MSKHRDMTRREVISLIFSGAVAGAQKPQFPKKAVIRTVLKDLPPEALAGGATLFHEHMSFSADFMPKLLALMRAQAGRGAAAPPPAQTGKYFMQDLDLMVEEIGVARKEGVACLVDGGHADMGRSLDFLKQLSRLSGMPIVASAGYYTSPFYPHEIAAWSEDQIAEELIRQAQAEPIGAFGEIGSSDAITADERKVFRAVAKAHLATNLPIFTHTALGKAAVEQLDIFESMGVKPQRVVIGHIGGLIDPKVEVHKAICKRGAFVGFDRQGGPGDSAQVPLVMALIEAGYADNLLFASDFSSAAQLKRNGGGGYAKTVTVFVPKLRQAGASEETLHGILVDNPRRFLAFVPKEARKTKTRKA